jgi:YebC/PmpR family DNA-binding regulatory protein
VYGKMGKMIVQAVKAGGPSPNSNSRLAAVLDQAKLVNCPRDIIERNIAKGSESKADYSEMTYEAYGPGGTGFIIEALTDNVNRTAGDVRGLMSKVEGKMAEMGSVKFNFSRVGVVRVGPGASEEQVFDAATEAGAEDILPVEADEESEGGFDVITSVESYGAVRAALEGMKLPINGEESGLTFRPTATVDVDDETYEKNQVMMERLLALDDVDAVYVNVAGLS